MQKRGVPQMYGQSVSLWSAWILLLASYTVKLHTLHMVSESSGGAFYLIVWAIGYAAMWLLTILVRIPQHPSTPLHSPTNSIKPSPCPPTVCSLPAGTPGARGWLPTAPQPQGLWQAWP